MIPKTTWVPDDFPGFLSSQKATATAPERSSPKFHPAVEAGVARGKPP